MSIRIQNLLLVIVLSAASILAQNPQRKSNLGKKFLTDEEVKRRCGIYISDEKLKELNIKQDIMYKEYLKQNGLKKETNTMAIPNWRELMGPVEDQADCKGCWAFASVGVTEGKLHYFLGYNAGIDLDEMDVIQHSGGGDCHGGFPYYALEYIKNSRVPVEPGLNSFPNYPGATYSILNETPVYGITAIKNALNSSPVLACFMVYKDFQPFFQSNPTGIYRYNNVAEQDMGHAVVIVGYDDANQCWIVKNSWGTAWGDQGYFKIGYGQCLIETMEAYYLTVNQGSLAKILPNFHSSLSTVMSYSFSNTETIYVFAGTSNATSNVTIRGGITLKTSPGANISFSPGTQLTINGTLLADGTAFNCSQQGSTWKGIKLISTGSNTYIRNCNISNFGPGYGADGIYIENCSPVIEYNTIGYGTYNGIKIYGGSPRIENNTIQFCDNGNGITVENGASLSIYNNYIHHTYYHGISVYANPGSVTLNTNNLYNCGYITRSYTGVRVYGSTNVEAFKNTISSCYYGVYSESSSQIDFGSYLGPSFFFTNNQITDCSYGLVSTGSSQIIAGKEMNYGEGYSANHNKIDNNYNYDLHATNNSTIYAYDNDFGGSAPTIYKDASSNIYYSNNSGPNSLAKNSLAVSGNVSSSDEDASLFEANILINKGSFFEAKDILKGQIEKGSIKALTYLLKLYNSSKDDELRVYLEELSSKNGKKGAGNPYKNALLKLYFNAKEYEQALMTADELISQGSKEAKIDKFLTYALGFRNNSKALSVLQDIKGTFGKEKADELYTLLLPDVNDEDICEQPIAKLDKNAEVIKPTEYMLSQNHPNPFNPSTLINYQIPKSGMVILKVYDMLGKEVAILVNENKAEGKYSVQFNAGNLPSGMYIYTLESGGFKDIKKLLLLK